MVNEPAPQESAPASTSGHMPPTMASDPTPSAKQEPAAQTMVRDAIGLLTEDHRKAELLFAAYAQIRLGDSIEEKFSVAKQVCGDLLIHLAIEEAIFYPKVRQALADGVLVDEAEHEHDNAKDLIKELGDIDPADPVFDTKIEALAQQIAEHVEKEETVIFPNMLIAPVDLVALGQELATAKSDMRSRLGLPPE